MLNKDQKAQECDATMIRNNIVPGTKKNNKRNLKSESKASNNKSQIAKIK